MPVSLCIHSASLCPLVALTSYWKLSEEYYDSDFSLEESLLFHGFYFQEAHQVLTVNILKTRPQKRYRCIERTFRLCGRGRGWDDLGEWHWNMYTIIYETNRQSRFDAWYRMIGASALGWPRGMVQGGKWEGGSGLGTHVHPWLIHVNVWQNQYSILK